MSPTDHRNPFSGRRTARLGVGVSLVPVPFGRVQAAVQEGRWIQTIPGKGWFTYFRIYGPQAAAFDGTWKPGDFEGVK
jgi:hypothetical protein